MAIPNSKSPGLRRERLSSGQRLHHPRDFERVYAAKNAVHTSSVVVFFNRNGTAFSRLGVSVGVKHGNAVRRNRIKRVLRAAFRQCRDMLPGGMDYVLVPRKGVQSYTTADVAQKLAEAARRVALVKP